MSSRDWVPAGLAAGLGVLMIWLAGAPFARSVRPAELALLAPRGEVPEFPRRFAWTEVPGAGLYEIFVTSADGAEPLFRQRGTSAVLDLAFDRGAEPPPGDYRWEVAALREGRVLARAAASFSVSPAP